MSQVFGKSNSGPLKAAIAALFGQSTDTKRKRWPNPPKLGRTYHKSGQGPRECRRRVMQARGEWPLKIEPGMELYVTPPDLKGRSYPCQAVRVERGGGRVVIRTQTGEIRSCPKSWLTQRERIAQSA